MERGLVQMRDYQTARRKLESRRLTYDSVLSKVQKMKKEDVRTEEELRIARAKYEETSEDVHNRMTAIQEAEVNDSLSPSVPKYYLTCVTGR
jgi:BAR domain